MDGAMFGDRGDVSKRDDVTWIAGSRDKLLREKAAEETVRRSEDFGALTADKEGLAQRAFV